MIFKSLFLMLVASLFGFTVTDVPIETNTNFKVGNKIEVKDEEDDSDEGIFLLGFEMSIEENEM